MWEMEEQAYHSKESGAFVTKIVYKMLQVVVAKIAIPTEKCNL